MKMFIYAFGIVSTLAFFRFVLGGTGFFLAVHALRITVQARRSRPRHEEHPTDSLALFPPSAHAHFTTPQARRKRSRLLLAMAVCLLLAPLLAAGEELLDEPTSLWPRYTATITAVQTVGSPEFVRLTYTYDNPAQGIPLLSDLAPDRIYESAQVPAATGPYAVGDELRVFVDPYDPDDSVLDPPLISRDVTPVYVTTLMTPFLLIVLVISGPTVVWVLRRRKHSSVEHPVVNTPAIRHHLAPLGQHVGAQLQWQPRWHPASAVQGIRHVLMYEEIMFGVLEYDPTAKHLRAVFEAGAYTVDCTSVRHTAATHAYASADVVPMRPLIVRQGEREVATLRFRGMDFTKLFIHGGPSYTLHNYQAYRPQAREQVVMVYRRKTLPSGLGRRGSIRMKVFSYNPPWRRSYIRFQEALPVDHLALLALAGWFKTRWNLATQQIDWAEVLKERSQQ